LKRCNASISISNVCDYLALSHQIAQQELEVLRNHPYSLLSLTTNGDFKGILFNKGTIGQGNWKLNGGNYIADSQPYSLQGVAFRTMLYLGL